MEKTVVAVLKRNGEVGLRQRDVLHHPPLQKENGTQYNTVLC